MNGSIILPNASGMEEGCLGIMLNEIWGDWRDDEQGHFNSYGSMLCRRFGHRILEAGKILEWHCDWQSLFLLRLL